MYIHDVTLAITKFRYLIPYNAHLDVYDAFNIANSIDYPTPEANRIIRYLVSNIQYDKILSIDLDNTIFTNILQDRTITPPSSLYRKVLDKNLILIILSREFGLPNENIRDMIEVINNLRLNIIEDFDSKPRNMRWAYGLLYAFLSNIDFSYYNIVREEDAVMFGEAYYLYSYLDSAREIVKQHYKNLSAASQYILLRLLGYDKIVDLDILTEQSIANFLDFVPFEFSEYAITTRILYSSQSKVIVETIAKTFDDYLSCYMPRFLYLKQIPPITPYLFDLMIFPEIAIRNLGIVIPEFQYDKVKYVLNNAKDYNVMVTLRQGNPNANANANLSYFADIELLTLHGYINYSSRSSLVKGLTDLQKTKGFFVPLANKKSINQETAYCEKVNEIQTVAYGTLNNYHCYSEQEFLHMITYSKETKTTSLTLWHDNTVIDDVDQLTQLRTLLLNFPEFARVTELLQQYLTQSVNVDEHTKEQFVTLTSVEKEIVKGLLIQVFVIGMFMRRWDGSSSYPMRLSQTTININPEPNVLEALDNFYTIYENASHEVKSFFSSLPAYRNKHVRSTTSMLNLIKNISQGENVNELDSCIRTNNSKLIFSAYRYLIDLYAYSIPGFNIDDFEIIH